MESLSDNLAVTGAWVVNTYKTIQGFNLNDSVFDPYETIILAAKASMLLSPMRKLGEVNAHDFDIYRKIAGLKPRECMNIIQFLEKIEAVDIMWDNEAISSISVRNTEKVDILSTTGKLFLELKPTSQAVITIHMLQETLKIPIPKSILKSLLAGKGFSEQIIDRTLQHLLVLKILAETNDKENGSALIYNPNAFQANAQDVYAAISGLRPQEKQEAMDILEYVKSNPGLPLDPKFTNGTIDLLIKCGLIDSSAIVTSRGRVTQQFTTAPYIWGALGAYELGSDVLDDAKLLLNCLRYGQLFSETSRGRINDPLVLVNSLINKGSVGPATAIGQDYPMPLARGIVSIVESKLVPGRYFMELKKEDVAQTVQEVLNTQGALPTPIDDDEVARKLKQQGNFISSEEVRIKKQLPVELEQERDSLAFCLRTHRRGR